MENLRTIPQRSVVSALSGGILQRPVRADLGAMDCCVGRAESDEMSLAQIIRYTLAVGPAGLEAMLAGEVFGVLLRRLVHADSMGRVAPGMI